MIVFTLTVLCATNYSDLSNANIGINCYGICTLTETKMNSGTTIREENILNSNGLFKNLYAKYTGVKNNNTLVAETQYERDFTQDYLAELQVYTIA